MWHWESEVSPNRSRFWEVQQSKKKSHIHWVSFEIQFLGDNLELLGWQRDQVVANWARKKLSQPIMCWVEMAA